jgi:predicted secreted protein
MLKILLFLLLSLAISIENVENSNSGTFTLNNMSQGTWNISAHKNKEIALKLKGNATTGYAWFLDTSLGLDNSLLVATNLNAEGGSSEYVPDTFRGFGSGGYYIFRFKTLSSSGLAKIRFVYKRSWETDVLYKLTAEVKIS